MYFISLFTVVIMWVHIWLFEHATSHRNFVDFPGAFIIVVLKSSPQKKKNSKKYWSKTYNFQNVWRFPTPKSRTANKFHYLHHLYMYVHIVFWYIFFFCVALFFMVFLQQSFLVLNLLHQNHILYVIWTNI